MPEITQDEIRQAREWVVLKKAMKELAVKYQMTGHDEMKMEACAERAYLFGLSTSQKDRIKNRHVAPRPILDKNTNIVYVRGLKMRILEIAGKPPAWND